MQTEKPKFIDRQQRLINQLAYKTNQLKMVPLQSYIEAIKASLVKLDQTDSAATAYATGERILLQSLPRRVD
jgi:hypothetical protein